MDEDPTHDPMIGRRPGLVVALKVAMSNGSGSEELALANFGTTGILDSNTVGFLQRLRHAQEFGSFLVCYRGDKQKEGEYGHQYVAALDTSFDMILKSPFPRQAEQVFIALLQEFKGRKYCNFPNKHYLPVIKPVLPYLRRRETLLHRAVRAGRLAVVEALLLADADWEMANMNWQAPLILSRLLAQGQNPNLKANYGTFWQRLSPVRPSISYREDHSGSERAKIQALIELKSRTATLRVRSIVRALVEVRWPWDEYEVDGFGIKMFIYYTLIVITILLPIAFVIRFIFFSIPSALVEVGDAIGDIGVGVAEFGKCYVDTKRNGTDTLTLCSLQFTKNFDFHGTILLNLAADFVGLLDTCYNETMPIYRGYDPLVGRITGCATKDYNWADDVMKKLESSRYKEQVQKFVRENSECRCTWGGKPYRGD